MRRWLLALAVAFAPALVYAVAAQTTGSFAIIYNRADTDGDRLSTAAQMILCDVSGNVPDGTPSDARVGGETCETGDWTEALDCTGASVVTMTVNEFGTGSGEVVLWNVQPALGTATTPPLVRGGPTLSNLGLPGVEAPYATPGPTDPDPLAVNLNVSNGVTTVVDGTSVRALSVTDRAFDYLVAEIDDCTGNCDMRVVVRCDW